MRIRAIAGIVTALALVGVGFGASQASSSPGAHTQHFIAFGNSSTNQEVQTVVAAGPVSGNGHDVVINDNTDHFVFAHGAVVVVHHKAHDHSTFDRSTCVFDYHETGTYRVTGGTGAYMNARGNGTYAVHVIGQGCDQNRPPKVFAITIDASGPLTI